MKVLALDIGHGDELYFSDLSHIVNAENVLMRNFAGEKQFLFEAAEGFGIAHHPLTDDFDRDQAIKILVISLINAAHTALPEEGFNAVAGTKIAARRERRRVHHAYGGRIANRHRGAAMTARIGEVRICCTAMRAVQCHKPRNNASATGK